MRQLKYKSKRKKRGKLLWVRLMFTRKVDPGVARYERRKRAQTTECVNPRKVYVRDKWICQLCGRPVNPNLHYPNKMSPTLDHIVPISLGGKHCYANVQLAHWQCNVKRGNRPIKIVARKWSFMRWLLSSHLMKLLNEEADAA